ncbi:MAG: type 1 periplasmic binding fold superfamily protein [Saprospiraceae bacterium]|nr:type 1 periplasmic binding fold superfamily protein [Saprospiraceae bacterium]
MNTLSKFLFLFIAVISLTLSACHKYHDQDEEELITTVRLKFTPATGPVLTYSWQDLDGAGGNAPTIPTINLAVNTVYSVELELLNESETPADNITEEIQAEAEEHLFVFNSTTSGLSILITDKDRNNNDLGLQSTWTTTNAVSGNVNIVLKHNPDKTATNPAVTGSTDIDVTFPVLIE